MLTGPIASAVDIFFITSIYIASQHHPSSTCIPAHDGWVADGVKIEVLVMKTVSAALLMWLVSILVPLRRCGAVSAKGTASADLQAARRLVRWWDWELYRVCSTAEHC